MRTVLKIIVALVGIVIIGMAATAIGCAVHSKLVADILSICGGGALGYVISGWCWK